MSLVSRLSSVLRTAARSSAVRRGARDLGRAAMRSVKKQRGGSGTASGGTQRAQTDRSTPTSSRPASHDAGAPDDVSRRATGSEGAHALADRDTSRPVTFTYAPHKDDRPDPGEIVWAWVPYEEDITQGKDRPVLAIAQEDAAVGGSDGSGEVLVALMLTSRDRADAGEVTTDEHGSTWVDIGSGDWDSQGRPSEVRADRLLRIHPGSVRREGARLDQDRFDRVATAVRNAHGWRG